MTMIEAADTRQSREIRFRRWANCLLAGAVGDAWGYEVEFSSLAEIRGRHGPRGLTGPTLRPGGQLMVSDDTQMTMFVLEGALSALRDGRGLADDEVLLERLRLACLDWHATQFDGSRHRQIGSLAGLALMRHRRAPGNTCMSALDNGGQGTVETPVNDSKGCGGAMRIAAIPLIAASPEDACRLAARHAAISHGHPDGYGSAGFLAALLWHLCDGAAPMAAAVSAIGDLSLFAMSLPAGRRPGTALYQQALALAGAPGSGVELPASLGEGWTGDEAVAIGLWAALQGHTLVDAISIAVNHDGDSDSTAAIAGQIRAAAAVDAPIPAAWATALDVAPVLSSMLRTATALIVDAGVRHCPPGSRRHDLDDGDETVVISEEVRR